jgi:Barrel-sandwich domain of CusB or HlyD membrane-fusion/Mechanosensitive ion channel
MHSRITKTPRTITTNAQANLADAKANLLTAELKLSYTKVYASVNGEVTNLDISEGAYASAGQQVMALVDRDSYWIAAYFKETQLRHIARGDTAIISLMGNEDLPFGGTVRSMGFGLALQSTLGDVFSGLSLSIEKPYRIGDEILLGGRSCRRGDSDELAFHTPQERCERCRHRSE